MVSIITRVAGSTPLDLETQTHMRVAVESMRGTLFDWCSGLLPMMKKQLYYCKRGRIKNFGYDSIIVSFFFVKVAEAVSRVVTAMTSIPDGIDMCLLLSNFHMLE